MIEIRFDREDKRYCITWWQEELQGNDGPIMEQIVAVLMGWA